MIIEFHQIWFWYNFSDVDKKKLDSIFPIPHTETCCRYIISHFEHISFPSLLYNIQHNNCKLMTPIWYDSAYRSAPDCLGKTKLDEFKLASLSLQLVIHWPRLCIFSAKINLRDNGTKVASRKFQWLANLENVFSIRKYCMIKTIRFQKVRSEFIHNSVMVSIMYIVLGEKFDLVAKRNYLMYIRYARHLKIYVQISRLLSMRDVRKGIWKADDNN
jgi:hypothetical protein